MGHGYSVDFRNRVVQAIKKLGLTYKAASEISGISEATISGNGAVTFGERRAIGVFAKEGLLKA